VVARTESSPELAPPLSGRPLRALLVSYSFPPVGGAGVQRVLKLTKYLPHHGVVPRVLTVSNPSVPVLDPSLEKDFPPGLEVLRARTFEPGYAMKQAAWTSLSENGAGAPRKPRLAKRLVNSAVKRLSGVVKELLVPDPQILWQPAAQLEAAKALFTGDRTDVVFISGPPFSQFLLAPLARLRGKTALVLDYRDEWSTYRSTYEMMGGRLTALAGDPLEAALLKLAHAVTTATEEFRANLLGRFRFLDPARVFAIPNGYDPDDFPGGLPDPPTDKLVLSYAGTVFKLTSARGLLRAVRRLHAKEPELAKLLSVRFMGRIVETELDSFEGMEALGVRRLGYLEHGTVLRELSASHRVLCILDDVPGVERIYPAKIFELMYLGRACLTLSPPGALTRLVATHHLGDVLAPRDEEKIAAYLEEKLRAFKAGARAEKPSAVGIERYHRSRLAGELADVMRDAVGRAGRAGHAAR
jgi:glycosyltransferase involved in cell wall biosynthesis